MSMNITPDEISVMIYDDYKKEFITTWISWIVTADCYDSCATVYNWYAEFNRGRDHSEDEPCAAQPRSMPIPENIEAVHQLINVHPYVIYQ